MQRHSLALTISTFCEELFQHDCFIFGLENHIILLNWQIDYDNSYVDVHAKPYSSSW